MVFIVNSTIFYKAHTKAFSWSINSISTLWARLFSVSGNKISPQNNNTHAVLDEKKKNSHTHVNGLFMLYLIYAGCGNFDCTCALHSVTFCGLFPWLHWNLQGLSVLITANMAVCLNSWVWKLVYINYIMPHILMCLIHGPSISS